MSQWTHITACMSVDTYMRNKKRIKKPIIEYINNAPKITGSESDADVYINLQHGYNVSGWNRGRPQEYQTCIVVSIQGDLRDKDGETTKEEVFERIKKLEEKNEKSN